MEVPDHVLAGRVVMVIWHQAHKPEVMQPLLERMMERVGETGRVVVESAERLIIVNHPQSSVDVVLSGYLPPPSFSHSSAFLAELAKVLKPSGTLILREPVSTRGAISGLRPLSKLTSALKLSGLVDVSEVQLVEPTPPDLQRGLKVCGVTVGEEELEGVAVAHVQAKKPSYEVGASSQLSFASRLQPQNREQPKVSSETAQIWSLSAADALDDDLDLMDSNTLLEEEDLLKPDPASLRSQCGSGSGKKKACKDCTCGLADELESGEEVKPRPVTSSCGSCYLGDAFRCVSCPYLGMPAFKPGEQIRLSNRQLKADQ